mgnify:CR=1 FL=1|jgi:4-amino-4-deoxychorismate lyase
MPSWVDGRPAAELPLGDRGLAYGDGLFETIAVRQGQPTLFDAHLARLSAGCARLAIPCDEALIGAEIRAFSAELGDGVAKLILTRGDGRRGYARPEPATPRRILLGSPLPEYPRSHAEQGVCLYPCATRLAEQPLLAGLKHLNRLEQVLARSEWSDEAYAEGLLHDAQGRVIEAVFSNLFLVKAGCLLTASLERCGVAGVMRGALLEQARALRLQVEIRDIPHDELLAADEVFVCNSVYGIWPVRRLDRHVWPVGPLTRKLQGIARTLLEVR